MRVPLVLPLAAATLALVPYLVSFAFYEENGALPGLQRFDSVRVDCPDPPGWLCDLSGSS